MCNMTELCAWPDLFIWVTWLIHVCDMTHSWWWLDSFIRVARLIRISEMTWRDSSMCVTWLIHMSHTEELSTYPLNESCHTHKWVMSRSRGNVDSSSARDIWIGLPETFWMSHISRIPMQPNCQMCYVTFKGSWQLFCGWHMNWVARDILNESCLPHPNATQLSRIGLQFNCQVPVGLPETGIILMCDMTHTPDKTYSLQ